jgi:hypothetical protein
LTLTPSPRRDTLPQLEIIFGQAIAQMFDVPQRKHGNGSSAMADHCHDQDESPHPRQDCTEHYVRR